MASYRSIEGPKKRFLKSDSLQPFGKDWKILVLLWGVMIGFGGGCIRPFGAKYCGCALHSWVFDDLTRWPTFDCRHPVIPPQFYCWYILGGSKSHLLYCCDPGKRPSSRNQHLFF